MKKLTEEEFISRSREIHFDKYDYNKSKYKNIKTKLVIKCPIHGYFLQTPHNHLCGHGCKLCANVEISNTKECFLKKS